MSEKSFTLEILTPERTVFTGPVVSLVAPAALGYLGVLANHAPFVSTLTPGKIICRRSGGQPEIFPSAGSGLVEVYKNRATVLADRIEHT